MRSDDDVIEELEIDIAVDNCAEILEAHGVNPTEELLIALWDWREEARHGA